MTGIIRRKDPGEAWETVVDTGGGGDAPVNWAILTFADPGARTVGSPGYTFQEADLSIASQSGSDFSVGTANGTGALLSASGGAFQAGGYVGCPSDSTLDGGSTEQRWLWFGAQVGSNVGADNPFVGAGLDVTLPIVTGSPGGYIASACASTIGYAQPGDPVLFNISLRALLLFGSDSIPLGNVGPFSFGVWQL